MPTITSQLNNAFRAAIKSAFDLDYDPMVGPAQNAAFGDYQANAAMSLAKVVADKTGVKTNPRAVAEMITAKLDLGELASAQQVSIAGPGFINVKLSLKWINQRLIEMGQDVRLGIEKTDQRQTVVVDYSGPNIAKEMHVGHLRSTIIGDAVSRVLEFRGDDVIRQNHIGDWGTQFGKVILAIWTMCNAGRHDELSGVLEACKQMATLNKSIADAEKVLKEKEPAKGDGKHPPVAVAARDPAVDAAARARIAEATQIRRMIIKAAAERHQKYLNEDPDGLIYFAPFLEAYVPALDKLTPVYQWINYVEDAPEADEFQITGPHGARPLSAQSKLVTSFLQKGGPAHKQELDAWLKVRNATMDECQQIYERLGVALKREHERGESSYNDDLANVVDDLTKKGLATLSDGAVAVFIDGPDKTPLVIEKKDGDGYLYGTTDLAAIRYRVGKLKADRVLYFVDARQGQHFQQVFATAKRAGYGENVSFEHAAFGTMLGEDGKPFKTRGGGTVKLKDLLDEAVMRAAKVIDDREEASAEDATEIPEDARRKIADAVGIGGVKYSDLSKDRTSDYVFSWESMLAKVGNTGTYLQYAYARIQNIIRKGEQKPDPLLVVIEAAQEKALATLLLRFPEVLDLVSRELKPHHLCSYLYDLSTTFSSFYSACPVLKSDGGTRASRIALCDLVGRTLALGLELLGIQHPDQM